MSVDRLSKWWQVRVCGCMWLREKASGCRQRQVVAGGASGDK